MSEIAVEVNHVWKKFHRGEFHDSLRDFIPAMARRLIGRGPKRDELDEGDFWALKDVNFQVARGEVLGIIGANGAGKSTLLKILARIIKPNRGHMKVNGRLRALIEIAAGFHPDLTGRENIYLNGSILGMKKREIDRKFDEIVDFSGIEPFLDTPVKRYSSGMYTRLGFAVAAHLEPEILLVDEVLAVGDHTFQRKCLGKMSEMRTGGRTVLFVSHNMSAVTTLCKTVCWLAEGGIVALGDAADIVPQYLLEATAVDSDGARSLIDARRTAGDQQVRFTRIELRNAEGNLSSGFQVGEPVTIDFTLESDLEISGEIGYTVRTLDGISLWTSSSNDSGELLSIRPGEFRIRTKIDPNHLRPGKYVIQLGTTCLFCRDLIPEAIVFEVVPDRHYSGGSLYNLPGHLHFPYCWQVVSEE